MGQAYVYVYMKISEYPSCDSDEAQFSIDPIYHINVL